MAVADELRAIRERPDAGDRTKLLLARALKADRIAAALEQLRGRNVTLPVQLEGAEPGTLTNVRFTVHDVGVQDFPGDGGRTDRWLRAVLSARIAPNGRVLLTQESERNPFLWLNPPIMVPVGTEPNPDHDPEDPRSPTERTVFQENLLEAGRALLAGIRLA